MSVAAGFNTVSSCFFGGVHGVICSLEKSLCRVIGIKPGNTEAAGYGTHVRVALLIHEGSDSFRQRADL